MIETVLVIPVLVMLAFGTAEYGYYAYVKHAFTEAALAGVRQAIPSTGTNANVTAAVSQVMTAKSLQGCGYTVTTNPASVTTIATGTPTTVTVSCTWGNVGIHPLPTALGGISTSKTVSVSVVMLRE